LRTSVSSAQEAECSSSWPERPESDPNDQNVGRKYQ
jgi:hypothetical protein